MNEANSRVDTILNVDSEAQAKFDDLNSDSQPLNAQLINFPKGIQAILDTSLSSLSYQRVPTIISSFWAKKAALFTKLKLINASTNKIANSKP